MLGVGAGREVADGLLWKGACWAGRSDSEVFREAMGWTEAPIVGFPVNGMLDDMLMRLKRSCVDEWGEGERRWIPTEVDLLTRSLMGSKALQEGLCSQVVRNKILKKPIA